MPELEPIDPHFNVQEALALIDSEIAQSAWSLLKLLNDLDQVAASYMYLKNRAEMVKHALKLSDSYMLFKAISEAQQRMLDANIDYRLCQTDIQVLNLLNTLYD